MAKFSLGRDDDGEGEGSSRRRYKRRRGVRAQEREPAPAPEPDREVNELEEELLHHFEVQAQADHDRPQNEAVEEEKEEDDDGDGENGGSATDGGSAAGSSRAGRPISLTLTDPDVLDCPICFDSLTIPVFQCENGHAVCSSCCLKIRNKCPSCFLPTGYNRCRAIEKVLESVKTSCRNMKYGCEDSVSYSKKQDHEKTCIYAPCSCPLPGCDYVNSSEQLYLHFRTTHPYSAERFSLDCICPINLRLEEKYLILQEQNEGILFMISNVGEILGNVISVSSIKPPNSLYGVFYYDLVARHGNAMIKLQSLARSTAVWEEDDIPNRFLLVPSDFIGPNRQINLELRIWRFHSSSG